MRGGALLAGYAVVLGAAGPYALKRLRWLERMPRLGVAVWLTALWSMLVSVVLAGLMAAQAPHFVHDAVAELIQACLHVFHHRYGTTPAAGIAGLVAVSFVVGCLILHAVAMTCRNRATRRRHLAVVDVVGRREATLGVTVIDHAAVIAYCVPGRTGRIVVTSAAIRVLGPEELAAVVAHERAHLSGRHHLLLGAAGIIRAALPFVPLARQAPAAVEYLVERLADERASRHHDRYDVASALLAAGTAKAPAGSMGMGGSTARSRALQLIRPVAPARWACWLVGLVGTATLVLFAVVPFLFVVIPGIGTAFADHCPFPDA
jgi:beta-lactamase regulating signal transducer with metallopeptidase domain